MSNFMNFSISRKCSKYIQIIFILSCVISMIKSDGIYTEESMRVDKFVGGLGIGTFIVVVGIALGIVVMILGLAFPNPALFVLIGALIPTILFLIVIYLPRESDTKEVLENENDKKNLYMIARYLHFILMALLFLGLLGPAFIKWGITIIPQRVDSTSQRDFYDDKYLEKIEIQKKRKYNLEENEALLQDRLPLNLNRNRRNNFIRNNQNTSNNLINDSNSQNNNLVDNTNGENSSEMNRNILPKKSKNRFNKDKEKYGPFKRTHNK